MADDIRVSPTPIQRNIQDVATDLTQLIYTKWAPESVEEVQETYAKMFAIASALQRREIDYMKFIPENLK